jgi:hypothetical protein
MEQKRLASMLSSEEHFTTLISMLVCAFYWQKCLLQCFSEQSPVGNPYKIAYYIALQTLLSERNNELQCM